MRLWIGVFLPHLPLEVFRPTWSNETGSTSYPPLAVLENGRVVAMSRAAQAAGVHRGMRRGGVLTLTPHAQLHERDHARETDTLAGLALALMQYTPQVAFDKWEADPAAARGRGLKGGRAGHAGHAQAGGAAGRAGTYGLQTPLIVADVSASLRLFGGIRSLRRRIQATLTASGLTARLSLAPTGTAAALLARAGGATVLHPTDHRAWRSLNNVLAPLPLALLPDALPHLHGLTGLGCATVGDLQRLPRAGVKQRCGEALLDTLDRALGVNEERAVWLSVPEQFDQRQELPDRANDTAPILASATTLIGRLTGWLGVRQWAVSRFTLALEHERGRQARPPTEIDIALADPVWHDAHLLRLTAERLAKTPLDAYVIAVRLIATTVSPMQPPSASLFPEPGGSPADHRRLLELLQARLGADNVLVCQPQEDYRPERANCWQPTRPQASHPAGGETRTSARTGATGIARANPLEETVVAGTLSEAARARIAEQTPRPAWLLDTPLPLLTRQHRPFYGSALRLVSPGERIESGWWDDRVITRDYFVAQGADHTCYWVFRERLGKPPGKRSPEHSTQSATQSTTRNPGQSPNHGSDQNSHQNSGPNSNRNPNQSAGQSTDSAEETHWFLHGFFG